MFTYRFFMGFFEKFCRKLFQKRFLVFLSANHRARIFREVIEIPKKYLWVFFWKFLPEFFLQLFQIFSQNFRKLFQSSSGISSKEVFGILPKFPLERFILKVLPGSTDNSSRKICRNSVSSSSGNSLEDFSKNLVEVPTGVHSVVTQGNSANILGYLSEVLLAILSDVCLRILRKVILDFPNISGVTNSSSKIIRIFSRVSRGIPLGVRSETFIAIPPIVHVGVLSRATLGFFFKQSSGNSFK